VLPAACACCGNPAAASRVEVRTADEASLIIPYCSVCQAHVSAATTRVLAPTLASCLLAGTLAASLPILWTEGPAVLLVVLSLLGAALPLLVALRWRPRPQPGHTAGGRAVFWLRSGELACSNPKWAAELAARSGVSARRVWLVERSLSPWMLSGLILALLAGPFFVWLHRPLVRVINLTDGRITVTVDGRVVARLDPTSAESPAAGAEVRVPAGERRLVSIAADGRVVAESRVSVRAGRQHLYAPGSDDYCFWLETVGYGRLVREAPSIEPLRGALRFWVLPAVDTWFSPNPPPAAQDDRSSGGELTALRQARCTQAPPAAQPH